MIDTHICTETHWIRVLQYGQQWNFKMNTAHSKNLLSVVANERWNGKYHAKFTHRCKDDTRTQWKSQLDSVSIELYGCLLSQLTKNNRNKENNNRMTIRIYFRLFTIATIRTFLLIEQFLSNTIANHDYQQLLFRRFAHMPNTLIWCGVKKSMHKAHWNKNNNNDNSIIFLCSLDKTTPNELSAHQPSQRCTEWASNDGKKEQ